MLDRSQNLVVEGLRLRRLPPQFTAHDGRLLTEIAHASAKNRIYIFVHQSRVKQLSDHVSKSARGMKMIHVGQPIRVDARH